MNNEAIAAAPATPGPSPEERVDVGLNGQALRVPVGTTLDTLLARFANAEASRCATAVNGQFVARSARASTPLRDGDEVTTFQAIVGG